MAGNIDEELARGERKAASTVKWMILVVAITLTWKMLPQLGAPPSLYHHHPTTSTPGEGTMESSIRLLTTGTPMFTKTGCQRVGALAAASEQAATAAVEANAIPKLLQVLTRMPQPGAAHMQADGKRAPFP